LRKLWRWASFPTASLLKIMGGPFTAISEIIGGLHEESIFLCDNSLEGTCRVAQSLGTHKFMYKDMVTGIYFHRGLNGEPGRGLIYQGL
jgi:hypothetical protein